MGYPVGIAPDADGNGTAPEDMRRWIWSLYRAETPSIVRGLTVAGRSDMAYAVSAGVAVFPTGAQEAIAVPFDAVDVAAPPAPSSGSRTDHIYATSEGAVMVGTVQPAGTSLIDKRTVPANITATTATTSTLGNRRFAPLFGSSMGEIAYWKHGAADLSKISDKRTLLTSQTITLESDRRLNFELQVTYEMSREANVTTNGWKTASFVWEIWVDGVMRRTFTLGVPEFAETKMNTTSWELTEGTHTIDLYRTRGLQGTDDPDNDYPVLRSGGSGNYAGNTFKIVDIGGMD